MPAGRPRAAAGAVRCRCGRQHRSWSAVARCLWPSARWAGAANPPTTDPCWATVSACGPGVTVELHTSRRRAEAALRELAETGCGGRCQGRHRLVELKGMPQPPSR